MFNVYVCVGGWVGGAGGGMSGDDLRPPSHVLRAMSCSKTRCSQIALARV